MNEQHNISRSGRLDELKKQLKDRFVNRGTLTSEIKKQNEQKNARSNAWVEEVKANWFIYFLLGVSSLFTGMLGLFMGLAPHLIPDPNNPGQQLISFNTDGGHLFIAMVYMLTFVTITEGAFIVGKWWFHKREAENGWQTITMILVMVFAFISILGTGYAGGSVVASTLGFLSEFKEIPSWAQEWVVKIIPVLIGVYAVLFTLYWLMSHKAENDRIAHQKRVELQQDHAMTMELIELAMEEDLMVEEADKYIALVRAGRISIGDARAAIRARTTLPELEEQNHQDYDGDGHIGRPQPRPGLMLPPEEYNKLADKYPNIPGTFVPNQEPTWECPNCQTINTGISSYCGNCGTAKDQKRTPRSYHPVPMDPRERGNGQNP